MKQRLGSAIVMIAIVLAACGGTNASTGPSTAPSTAASPEPSTAASAAASTAASEEPGGSPAASSGGGGGAANACELITGDEFGGVVGATGVTSQLFDGPVSSCIYSSGSGDPVGATSLTKDGAAGVFAVWASSSGVTKVDGVGDDAVWDPSSATLFVLKGTMLTGIAAGTGSDAEDARKAWATDLGKIAAGRM